MVMQSETQTISTARGVVASLRSTTPDVLHGHTTANYGATQYSDEVPRTYDMSRVACRKRKDCASDCRASPNGLSFELPTYAATAPATDTPNAVFFWCVLVTPVTNATASMTPARMAQDIAAKVKLSIGKIDPNSLGFVWCRFWRHCDHSRPR